MPSGRYPAALASIMAVASDEMKHSLAKSRAALSHNLSKGEAAEESVRVFFRSHLPSSLGVAKGQVIDCQGKQSRQIDVIIYDSLHTPILFNSEENGHQLVPSEGVLAAIEIKSRVDPGDVASILANMASIKSLDKSAYFSPRGILQTKTYVHGLEYDHFPTLYFLFAYDSGNLPALSSEFDKRISEFPVDKRLDCACVLSKGVLVNANRDGIIDAVPGPETKLSSYATSNALLLFYILITRYLLQAETRPIELRRYIPADWGILFWRRPSFGVTSMQHVREHHGRGHQRKPQRESATASSERAGRARPPRRYRLKSGRSTR